VSPSTTDPVPSFASRLVLAWIAYFRTLFDGEFARGVVQLRSGKLLAAEPEPRRLEKPAKKVVKKKPAAPKTVVLKETSGDAACQVLGLLQREGRFVDFVMEDLAGAKDADIGAAARVVHDGCRKALKEHFELVPVRSEEEGSRVEVAAGFDPSRTRLTGNVVGDPPFKGTLAHRGWRAEKVNLPKMTKDHDPTVLAPAEIEI
jgi:hypothetical protein